MDRTQQYPQWQQPYPAYAPNYGGNHYQPPEKKRRVPGAVKVLLGIAATGGVMWAALQYSGDAADWVDESRHQYESSKVIAGVPGQVEDRSDWHKNFWFPMHKHFRTWVLVEQCQKDVDAMRAKQPPTQSFDPAVGKVGEGCYWDWVHVDTEFYNRMPLSDEGKIIVPPGKPGANAQK